MEKTTKSMEPEKGTNPTLEAAPLTASWDVFYQDAQGLECHLQLKGTSLDAVLDQAKDASMAITEAGGQPSRRMSGNTRNGNTHNGDNGHKDNGNGRQNADNGTAREPTYVDKQGTRRCNRKLTDGTICGRPVTEKEGRYGLFWSCPNYKAHAPAPAR